MPSSHYFQLNEIVRLIELTRPQSILDIGVGFGKYGFLAREYLELGNGRINYGEWKIRIDGIEAFKKYLTPVHKFIYDQIYLGNALDILPTLKKRYDLILLVDVLEHFGYRQGMRLLAECKRQGKNMIVSVPKKIGKQKDIFENPFEIHKFSWQKKHFAKFQDKFFIPNQYSLIFYIGKDFVKIKESYGHSQIRSKIKEKFPFLKPVFRFFKSLTGWR